MVYWLRARYISARARRLVAYLDVIGPRAFLPNCQRAAQEGLALGVPAAAQSRARPDCSVLKPRQDDPAQATSPRWRTTVDREAPPRHTFPFPNTRPPDCSGWSRTHDALAQRLFPRQRESVGRELPPLRTSPGGCRTTAKAFRLLLTLGWSGGKTLSHMANDCRYSGSASA